MNLFAPTILQSRHPIELTIAYRQMIQAVHHHFQAVRVERQQDVFATRIGPYAGKQAQI